MKCHLGISIFPLIFLCFLCSANSLQNGDAAVMLKLRESLGNPANLWWSSSDPCNWNHVMCGYIKTQIRVVAIQISRQSLEGTLPPDLKNLTALKRFDVTFNNLTGQVPSLSGLSTLQEVLLHDNGFTSFPSDFFNGLNSLSTVSLDYNPFQPWEIPSSLKSASTLKEFSANGANLIGTIPEFLNNDMFPRLESLHLAMNSLEGGLPGNFSRSSFITSLWLNHQMSTCRLNGSIVVLQSMTGLTEIWLNGNQFTGPLPDFTDLKWLQIASFRDNQFTGIVPASLVNLPLLSVVNLTNNYFQGPTPEFPPSISVDMESSSNGFCTNVPGGDCDNRVDILLSVVK